jgi:ABC-type transport system substrate-binding protein
LERVELCLLPDLLAQYRRYENDQLDILDFWTIPFAERNRARYQHTEEYLSLPQLSTLYLCIDVNQPPFDDVRVRKALAYAIDKKTLANIFMQGDIAPAMGGFIPHGMPSHSPKIGIPFNPDRARSFLAEAGYSGSRKHFFPTIKGHFPGGTLAGLTDLLSQQWMEILGIEIRWEMAKATRLPGPANVPLITLNGAGCEYPDPAHFIRWSDFQKDSHWQNEKFLALSEEAQQTTVFSKQTALYHRADKILMDELPIIPLAYGRNLMLLKPWVKNYPISPLFYWPWKELIIEPHECHNIISL